MDLKWAPFWYTLFTITFTGECARMKLFTTVAQSVCEQLESFRESNVIPPPVKDQSISSGFPRAYVIIPKDGGELMYLEKQGEKWKGPRAEEDENEEQQVGTELMCHQCESWEGETNTGEPRRNCHNNPQRSVKLECPGIPRQKPVCQFTYYARKTGHLRRGVSRSCADPELPGYKVGACYAFSGPDEEYIRCWCNETMSRPNETGHCNHCAKRYVETLPIPQTWTYPAYTEEDSAFNFGRVCPRFPAQPPPPISTTTTTTTETPEIPPTPPTPAPPPANSTDRCKCHVCESILGKHSTYGCKDRPKSTAVRTCQPGEGCRTLASYSKTLKTWVLRRGCTPLRGTESRCTAYPPFAPPLCNDCKTPSCECVCKKDYCNDFTYPDGGWDVCGNKETCPGGPTEPPPPPSAQIECHNCTSYENDPSTWACKDKPETTQVVLCQVGEHCQTITYISPKTGGSALMRRCVRKEDVTNLCRKDRPIPIETRRLLRCESCKDPSCECLCDTNKCNDEVFEGGWKAC